MKSERRHELEKNQLANWLTSSVETVKPYTTAILGVILLVLVVFVAVSFWTRQSFARSGEAWNRYFAAFSSPSPAPTDFDKVAEQYPNSDVVPWAMVTASDLRLGYACNQMFYNRAMANQELRKATDGYLAVLRDVRTSTLRERATFGLARARETQGELDEALKTYQDVVKQWPNGAYAVESRQRVSELELRATKEFYDKFAKASPKPVEAEGTGKPVDRPAFDDKNVPEAPASVRPTPLKLDTKAGPDIKFQEPKPSTPKKPAASDEPAPSEKPAAPEKPAPSKPADAKK